MLVKGDQAYEVVYRETCLRVPTHLHYAESKSLYFKVKATAPGHVNVSYEERMDAIRKKGMDRAKVTEKKQRRLILKEG